MSLPYVASKEQALRELFPLTSTLYEVFPEAADEIVIPHFAVRGRPIDQGLATHMLRYEVRCSLDEVGISVFEDSDDSLGDMPSEFDMQPLPNSGIEGIFAGWRFKLLRSRTGEVPPPGRSDRRKRFYSQQLGLRGFDKLEELQVRPNVVVLWDFDVTYRRIDIRVAIPQEATGEYGAVRCYYNVQVPHPVIVTSRQPREESSHAIEPNVAWKKQGEEKVKEALSSNRKQ